MITSISMDHMQYLVNTIEEIAGEKAGILKPGVPVVYDVSCEESRTVIDVYKRQIVFSTHVGPRGVSVETIG